MAAESGVGIAKDWKYYLGVTLFVYSFLPYVVSGALLFFRIPIQNMIGLIGLFLGSAELAFVTSVILLGKPFVQALKARLKGLLCSRKGEHPCKPVGKVRHALGTSLFVLSFVPWFITEIALFYDYPKTEAEHWIMLACMLLADAVFVVSLFILGGDFWDRLKNLFRWPVTIAH